jgi:hypothetical protein
MALHSSYIALDLERRGVRIKGGVGVGSDAYKKVAGVVFEAAFEAGVSSTILSKKSVLKLIKKNRKTNIMLSCIIIMIIQNRRSKLEFIANKEEKFEKITNKIFTHAHSFLLGTFLGSYFDRLVHYICFVQCDLIQHLDSILERCSLCLS